MAFLRYSNKYLYSSEVKKKRSLREGCVFFFLLLSFVFFFHFFQKVGSENEVVQSLVGCIEDFVLGTFPFFMALIDINDAITNSHYGVHVVGIYNGGHVVFCGDVMNQFVDNQ